MAPKKVLALSFATLLMTSCAKELPVVETVPSQPTVIQTATSVNPNPIPGNLTEIVLPAKTESDTRKSIKVKLIYPSQGFGLKSVEELFVKAVVDRTNDGEHKEIDLITVDNAFSFTITASENDHLKIRIEVRNSAGTLLQEGEKELTVNSDTTEIEIPMENINIEEKPRVDVNVAGTIPKQETSKPSDLGVRDNNKKIDPNPGDNAILAPKNLTVDPTLSDKFTLHWEIVPNYVKYRIYLNGKLIREDITGNYVEYSALEAATTYTVGISAVNKDGKESEIATMDVTTAEATKVNQPPVIDSFEVTPEKTSGRVSESISTTLNVKASDPEGEALTYEISDEKGQIVLNSNTGSFTTTPGNHTFKAKVTDSGGLSATKETTINISLTQNNPPVITAFNFNAPSIENPGETGVASYTGSATDDKDTNLNYQLLLDDQVISNLANGNFRVSPGSHIAKLIVSDSEGATTFQTKSFFINTNKTPEITAFNVNPTNQSVLPNETAQISLQVLANDPQSPLTVIWYSNSGEIFRGFSGTVRLGAGTHNIKVIVRDGMNLESSMSKTITISQTQVKQVSITNAESSFINTEFSNTKLISKITYNDITKEIITGITKGDGSIFSFGGYLTAEFNGEIRRIEYFGGKTEIKFPVPISSLNSGNYNLNIYLYPSNLAGKAMRATGSTSLKFNIN